MNRFKIEVRGSGAEEVASADQLEKQGGANIGSLQSKIAAMKNVGALSDSPIV